ncbi:MAG: Uma2 family endonuclease [Cyanobacterium sp.]
MVAQLTKQQYTIEEYLELESQAEVRHEYIDGEILEMAGGTTNHNLVTGNIYIALRLALKGKNYPVFIENVRLWIAQHKMFTYPDVMVIAQNPEYHGENKTTVTNPIIIIEILSNSTRDYDLGRKFEYYRSLHSLQEYILVDPEKPLVMSYHRNSDQQWSLNILENINNTLTLNSISIKVNLKDIYEGIEKIDELP